MLDDSIKVVVMSAADWMVYNLAGHAAERLFNPNANRHTALRDDITAEKVLRVSFPRDLWAEFLDLAEQHSEYFYLVNMLLSRVEFCPSALGTHEATDLPRSVAKLRNAAEHSVARACDGNVKTSKPV